MHRPYLLETYNCTDVSVVGISLSNSPFWTVHPYVSSRIELRGLSIYAPVGSPNTDGIDPDSSSYVTIADTTIENGVWGGLGAGILQTSTESCDLASASRLNPGDDCIAIKSGRGPPGAAFAQASHHITVTNLTLLSGLGGEMVLRLPWVFLACASYRKVAPCSHTRRRGRWWGPRCSRVWSHDTQRPSAGSPPGLPHRPPLPISFFI